MKLKTELKSRWFALLVIALCCVVVVHFAYDTLTAPKDYETINVFITAKSCDNIAVNRALSEALDVKINVSSYSLEDKYYKESLQTSGLLMADILILPKSLLPENSIDKEFAPLQNAELERFGIDCDKLQFYVKDDVSYAIKIYDNTTNLNLLDKWTKFDGEDYYLLLNVARPNAAPYSSGKTTTTNAFAALAVMLSET